MQGFMPRPVNQAGAQGEEAGKGTANGGAVAYGSLFPSVTLYCSHQSLLLSTLVYLQYIHVHLQYCSPRSTSVVITLTSLYANPHRPQHPIIAQYHHLILSS